MIQEVIDYQAFNVRTNNKWRGEPLEVFKCAECGLIVVGVPGCHVAYYDPEDLDKVMQYNVPRKIHCPKCNRLWYDMGHSDSYDTEEVPAIELISSGWNWLCRRDDT